MINISKLYCGEASESDGLRYGQAGSTGFQPVPHGQDARATHKNQLGHGAPAAGGRAVPKAASERRPVVVWNCTRACNLKCIHCYTNSDAQKHANELTTEEARAMLRDLAQFGIPALLLSGGEPLLRRDLFDLADEARDLGLRCTLSTNGTLLDEATAGRIRRAGFTYVGVSLDGVGEVNDYFRGAPGAFERAMQAFRHCVAAGQRVGLRMTLTRHNVENLNNIFDFVEAEAIDRACFYHLAYSGRGSTLRADDLTHAETRAAMDVILDRTADSHRRGLAKEILTVDNHVDGVYVYLKLRDKDPERAESVRRLLEWNGGGLYSSGVGIGCIDWAGDVHPDQFWMHYSLGTVRRRPFSAIWMDTSDPLMRGLKDRRSHIRGQCRRCRFFDACGGSLRVRADAIYSDPWAWDPACYLTDEEIGLSPEDVAALRESGEYFERPLRETDDEQRTTDNGQRITDNGQRTTGNG